jgi:diguanylate cyclase (GGDEF)-like protein
MIDVDHFKRINDTHGHAAGDRVIAELGGILRAHSRIGDVACRHGGDEFAMVMLAAGLEDGVACADGWRKSFGAVSAAGTAAPAPAPPDHATGGAHTTLSAGVAEWTRAETAAELFARADAALYQAKHSGRNRVICAPPGP